MTYSLAINVPNGYIRKAFLQNAPITFWQNHDNKLFVLIGKEQKATWYEYIWGEPDIKAAWRLKRK